MGFQTAYCFNDYLGFDLGFGFDLELRDIWICLSRQNIFIRVLSIATSTFNARFSTSNLQFFIFINAALPLWLFTGVGFFLGATPYLDLEPHWIKIGSWGHLSSICSSWLLFAGVGFFLGATPYLDLEPHWTIFLSLLRQMISKIWNDRITSKFW